MPRKKPFSNKQKKQQLLQKRERKREKGDRFGWSEDKNDEEEDQASSSVRADASIGQEEESIAGSAKYEVKISVQYDPQRFRLDFNKETKKELDRRRYLAKTEPITPVLEMVHLHTVLWLGLVRKHVHILLDFFIPMKLILKAKTKPPVLSFLFIRAASMNSKGSAVLQTDMEVSMTDVYGEEDILDLPRRPPWTYSTSKEELLAAEEASFTEYLQGIHSRYSPGQLSYFEHNLETWRQLWRVLEMSDMVLLIADIRHPALHFSPALFRYVVDELKKKLILVLNKVDLVPPQVCVAWRHYFKSQFPRLEVICFTSYPNKESSTLQPQKAILKRIGRRGKLPAAVGPLELLKLVEKMYHGTINVDSWKYKVIVDDSITGEDIAEESEEDGDDEDSDECEGDEEEVEAADRLTEAERNQPMEAEELVPKLEKANEGVLTIGMVGHPNVGKSSIINALMTKKLVSTSRTPGHTKHFQTLYLTPSLRLCDCPGLVFPSLIDKQLQILSGLYPVAQVREPYTAVGYLARRVPLVTLLRLVHPEDDSGPSSKKSSDCSKSAGAASCGASAVTKEELLWTAWDICDAWAERRGFFTSRAARPDTYRAANNILRFAVEGRICMYFKPPGFCDNKDHWERHPEVSELIKLQNQGMGANNTPLSDIWRKHLQTSSSSEDSSCRDLEALKEHGSDCVMDKDNLERKD